MEFQCLWETLRGSVGYASESYYPESNGCELLPKDHYQPFDEVNVNSSALQSLLIYESMDPESQRKPLGRTAGAWAGGQWVNSSDVGIKKSSYLSVSQEGGRTQFLHVWYKKG